MSDNPNGAENQQESLSPEWVVSFVDGKGCFYVGVNRQPTMKLAGRSFQSSAWCSIKGMLPS